LVIGVMRDEEFISREGKSPGWDKFVPRIVNFAIEKLMPVTFPDVPRPKETKEELKKGPGPKPPPGQ